MQPTATPPDSRLHRSPGTGRLQGPPPRTERPQPHKRTRTAHATAHSTQSTITNHKSTEGGASNRFPSQLADRTAPGPHSSTSTHAFHSPPYTMRISTKHHESNKQHGCQLVNGSHASQLTDAAMFCDCARRTGRPLSCILLMPTGTCLGRRDLPRVSFFVPPPSLPMDGAAATSAATDWSRHRPRTDAAQLWAG